MHCVGLRGADTGSAVKDAQDASLIAVREVDSVQLVWLTKPEA
jgi:hypothetical protein